MRRAALQDPVHDGLGERGLATAREAGEEQHDALLAGRRPVEVDDGGDLVAQRGLAVVVGEPQDGVAAGVRRHHAHPERVVDVGVAVRREGYGDHGGVREPLGRGQAGPQQPDGGEVRRTVPDQRHQHHSALDRGQPGDLLLVEGVGHRDERGARVLVARLRRRQVEPAERAVLGVRQRPHRAVGRDDGQRQTLGVDELDLGRAGQLVGEVESDGRAGFVEPRRGVQRPRRQQLQVVELTRQRVVLGQLWRRSRHGRHPATQVELRPVMR